jgi:hypothetical protein
VSFTTLAYDTLLCPGEKGTGNIATFGLVCLKDRQDIYRARCELLQLNKLMALINLITADISHQTVMFQSYLLPPYRIIGQIYILRQTLTINFSQKI